MQQEFIEYVLLAKLQAARVNMQDQYLFHYTLGGQDTHNASEHMRWKKVSLKRSFLIEASGNVSPHKYGD